MPSSQAHGFQFEHHAAEGQGDFLLVLVVWIPFLIVWIEKSTNLLQKGTQGRFLIWVRGGLAQNAACVVDGFDARHHSGFVHREGDDADLPEAQLFEVADVIAL